MVVEVLEVLGRLPLVAEAVAAELVVLVLLVLGIRLLLLAVLVALPPLKAPTKEIV